MAPTFYHSWPEFVDMKEEEEEEACWGRRVLLLLVLALLLVAISLAVAVGILDNKANSKACLEGLKAEQQCRNATSLLEHQLSGIQHRLLSSENQASTCNHTVVSHPP